jgi:hypothetical protein
MTDPNARGAEYSGPGAESNVSKVSGEAGPYHILAASSLADERTRVLKHGDTFAVGLSHGLGLASR